MSTQYTNQAKTAVKYAEKTARRYKHSYIGTEHLLAGLLHEEEGTAGMVLRDMGISEERLMEMIRKLIAPEESNVLTADRQLHRSHILFLPAYGLLPANLLWIWWHLTRT